jgi:hypothetical protein
MTREERFIDALKQNINGKSQVPSVTQGIAINISNFKCDVKLTANGLTLTDVLFSATDKEVGGFILIPKENTGVLVGMIGNDENSLYLVSVDEIDALKIKIGEETVVIDSDGFKADLSAGKFTIKNQETDAKIILQDILDAMKNLTVSTANGPSGTPLPPTITAIDAIENKINQLFN